MEHGVWGCMLCFPKAHGATKSFLQQNWRAFCPLPLIFCFHAGYIPAAWPPSPFQHGARDVGVLGCNCLMPFDSKFRTVCPLPAWARARTARQENHVSVPIPHYLMILGSSVVKVLLFGGWRESGHQVFLVENDLPALSVADSVRFLPIPFRSPFSSL
jgi:hypothetical protein